MEKEVERLFSMALLEEAAQRYGATAADAKNLNGFENYVYEVKVGDESKVLRLTHSTHRTKAQVESELRWINYLHEQGINVSLVHQSLHGQLVEEFEVEGSYFFVCLFDKAPGSSVKLDSPELGTSLFEKWGEITAELHLAAENFNTSEIDRPHWYEDDLIELEKYLDSSKDQKIIDENRELVQEILKLPSAPDAYGLIHSDIHTGNFFYHEGDIHLFDFDDTVYFHYASDIAIPLYYMILLKYRDLSLEERSTHGRAFLQDFLRGYERKRKVEPEWIERLPLFLKLRDYTLYGVLHKKVDIEHAGERERALVTSLRDRLMRNELIVELDYQEIL
ncbi:phosphotransferase enzyme family protein [Jeotgalibacillus sp. R-1-5s-1]|uniref:phosphotransferase enzyme family protein n=1 Tax=Jeotgalibacillus sp. R-1-5s-1 TaxID=2555897 RepID=UPI00106A7FF4|nr:phosphotransferase [Jeotgalibacillus sp. R-1-5s-1]TFE00766.1 hypothetical protein E2491_04440 [Jeotgalibacillus sp. R-1-5s-1]